MPETKSIPNRMETQQMDPGFRPLRLLMILLGNPGRPFSLSDLAKELQCSPGRVSYFIPTISKMLGDRLQDMPVKGKRLFTYKRGAPAIEITPDNLDTLLICARVMEHLMPANLREKIFSPLKESKLIGDELVLTLCRGKVQYQQHQKFLHELFAAMKERKLCKIGYLVPDRARADYFLAGPMKIIALPTTLYLVCMKFDEKGTLLDPYRRRLALHRIKSVTVTKTLFTPPSTSDDDKTLFGLGDDSAPFEARIQFFSDAVHYVSERQWAGSQKIDKQPDGTIILSFKTRSTFEVKSWVQSFGANARLLEPENLAKEMAQDLKKALERYLVKTEVKSEKNQEDNGPFE